MTLDRSLALATTLCLALTLAIGSGFLISGSQTQLNESHSREMQSTALLLTSSMSQAASLSATHALAISRDPLVIEMMKAGERAGLARYLQPTYQSLASEAGVNMLHFHTPDIKSFLRVQDPGNFGQDLSGFRPMILAANRSQILQKGLEVGIAGLSLRAVAPVLDQETLIGTFEVGIELKTLMDLAKSASGADFALFLSPAMTGFSGSGQTAGADTFGLVIESATNTSLFEALYRSGAIGLQREPVQAFHAVDGTRYGTFAQPLLDYSGRMIGTIVIARDVSDLDGAFRRALITALTSGLIGLLIGYGLIMVAIRAIVLRPLERTAGDVGS
ncbi:hypothetical protein FE840_008635 [Peteryoungia desertarenae]|uniref:Double Cache domain-containing protein n=1 Tax=Peteryoungia desertarenae TaxID=1813451 RepID=A0ABX6QM30_9HYPH|nr:cache domain-containing protein [Peteryoungia desertarenae]QLF69603.1 hypothetical protein FE840_008635 [Peteryoungia desertarenae]